MAASVALNRQDLFNWSVKEYRIAARQIEADGTLPNERQRRERAAAYHNYALQPLVMIASFARPTVLTCSRKTNTPCNAWQTGFCSMITTIRTGCALLHPDKM
jgi:hypothetical protein